MTKALVIKDADFSANKLDTVVFEGVHTESIAVFPATIVASSIGATNQLTATLFPSDSIDVVQWISSNTNVATVRNGLVTITGCGTCTIIATSGTATATCAVAVEVELTGYTLCVGAMARPLNGTNDIPGWSTGMNPDTSAVSARYRSRAATVAVDQTETRLACDHELMTGVGGTLKPAGSRTGWSYRDYGWTVPVLLPHNCTKLKVYALNADYGSIPLYYKSAVVSNSYSGSICSRQPTGWYFSDVADPSDGPWVYAQMTEYDVPAGYDSVNVSWFIPEGDVTSASPLFTAMSDAQLAAFKVVCC